MVGPRIVKPVFRSPAWRSSVRPPAYPILAWDRRGDGVVTDSKPATATFISSSGIFLTARHVFELADDVAALRILFHEKERLVPSEMLYQSHPVSDLAVGYAPFPEGIPTECFLLGTRELAVGEEVWTFGYGEYAAVEHEGATPETKGLTMNLAAAFRSGTVLDVIPNGTPHARGPVYAHSNDTPGGNSGGPLLRAGTVSAPARAVHGIMSNGVRGETTADDYSISTSVSEVLDWPLSFAENLTLRDLARRGVVLFEE